MNTSSPLAQRDALVLARLSLADFIATSFFRRFHDLVEREDLIQVARLELVRAAARVVGDRPVPNLRHCMSGAPGASGSCAPATSRSTPRCRRGRLCRPWLIRGCSSAQRAASIGCCTRQSSATAAGVPGFPRNRLSRSNSRGVSHIP
jgi:hypothetical protein